MSDLTPQETFRELQRKYKHALKHDRINPEAASEIERRMNSIDRKLGRDTNDRLMTLVKIGVSMAAVYAISNLMEDNDLL